VLFVELVLINKNLMEDDDQAIVGFSKFLYYFDEKTKIIENIYDKKCMP
jgi:hypothetical protein